MKALLQCRWKARRCAGRLGSDISKERCCCHCHAHQQHRWIGSCSSSFLTWQLMLEREKSNRRIKAGYARVVCDLGSPDLLLSIRLLYIYIYIFYLSTVDSASAPARKGRFGIGREIWQNAGGGSRSRPGTGAQPMVGIGIGIGIERRTQKGSDLGPVW